ncbi:hypothetical protein QF026_001662 [Streptomyces aurantiacus]|nr:hypothetical protein [Streptomyces aurantiacus]
MVEAGTEAGLEGLGEGDAEAALLGPVGGQVIYADPVVDDVPADASRSAAWATATSPGSAVPRTGRGRSGVRCPEAAIRWRLLVMINISICNGRRLLHRL